MNPSPIRNQLLVKTWQPRFTATGRVVLRVIVGPLARISIIVISCMLALWLLYALVWVPLRGEVSVPAGVSEQNPVLKEDLLNAINSSRVKRREYTPTSFDRYASLFSVSEEKQRQ